MIPQLYLTCNSVIALDIESKVDFRTTVYFLPTFNQFAGYAHLLCLGMVLPPKRVEKVRTHIFNYLVSSVFWHGLNDASIVKPNLKD